MKSAIANYFDIVIVTYIFRSCSVITSHIHVFLLLILLLEVVVVVVLLIVIFVFAPVVPFPVQLVFTYRIY